jgi:type II secretory pathway pseudopilin PulG
LEATVADLHAGQSVSCSRCGKPVTIPDTPATSGAPLYAPRKPGNKAMNRIVPLAVGLVVLSVCGPMLVAMLLPSVQAAREAARRTTCQNNLKQIGAALRSYERTNGAFPPAVFTDDHGKPMKSWRVAILPYIRQSNLYRKYDSKQPWDSPQNRAVGNTPLDIFRCPSDSSATVNSTETNYVRIVGKDTVGGMPNEAVKISDITAETSFAIMVVEVSGLDIHWEEPRDVTVDEFMDMVAKGRVSHHFGGFNALTVDGSVHFINNSVKPKTLRSLLLRNDQYFKQMFITR